jgi:hypothetical protein
MTSTPGAAGWKVYTDLEAWEGGGVGVDTERSYTSKYV